MTACLKGFEMVSAAERGRRFLLLLLASERLARKYSELSLCLREAGLIKGETLLSGRELDRRSL